MAKAGCSVSVEEIMKAAERLPPFPTVIWEVTSLLRRMAPAREIEAVIRYDQAIAAKVLTMSCSAYYARRHAISSLRDAILARKCSSLEIWVNKRKKGMNNRLYDSLKRLLP